MTGFSLENHKPPSSIYLFWYLSNTQYLIILLAFYSLISYLLDNGSSFIASHTGQIDMVDDLNILTPSVFIMNEICAG